jgi:quinol-cytochrome oxidoreductase complex cytochrome b subunit
MVTPAHIVPEWYFLPFYAILRSIPDKLGGVICMVLAILVVAILPFLVPTVNTRSNMFRPITRKLFWIQLINCFILGWLGQNIVETPYIELGQICTLFYFVYFLILLPFVTRLEVVLMKNLSYTS